MALGSIFGSVALAPIASIGRRKCIMIADITVIAGSLLTFSSNLHVLYFGRLIYGCSSGAFGVFCSKYISEASPVEIRGSTGVLMELSVVTGMMLPFVIGLIQASYVKLEDMSEDQVWNFILIIFMLPIVFASI